jgi:hypothetical protein
MLNTYYDKFIFTGQIKFNNSNFHLIDIPFFIFPSPIKPIKGSPSGMDKFKRNSLSGRFFLKISLFTEL